MKTAIHPKGRTYCVPVGSNQKGQQFGHGVCNIPASSSKAIDFPVRRMEMSWLPRRPWWIRNHSRTCRFSRLRSTALGTVRLGTITPSLAIPSPFILSNTVRPGRLTARPPANNAAISAVRSRCLRRNLFRSFKRSNEPAPWRVAPEELPGLHACACEREIHGCASCELSRAGRFVS
jgi:hypothetical protein